MYQKGVGVDQSRDDALKWYRRAAEQGDVLAYHHFGSIYAKGFRDKKVGWFRRLRFAYLTTNYVEAYKWFTLAAKRGHAPSEKDRLVLKNSMTPDQIALAERMVQDTESCCSQSDSVEAAMWGRAIVGAIFNRGLIIFVYSIITLITTVPVMLKSFAVGAAALAACVLCFASVATVVGSVMTRREKKYRATDLIGISTIGLVLLVAGLALMIWSQFYLRLFDVEMDGLVWALVGAGVGAPDGATAGRAMTRAARTASIER
jgi:hypothetical protein